MALTSPRIPSNQAEVAMGFNPVQKMCKDEARLLRAWQNGMTLLSERLETHAPRSGSFERPWPFAVVSDHTCRRLR